MQKRFDAQRYRNHRKSSGPRTLASGSRRAQQEAARFATRSVPRSVLFVAFFAASLLTLWLLLTDHPAGGIVAAIAAVATLVCASVRSGSHSKGKAVVA